MTMRTRFSTLNGARSTSVLRRGHGGLALLACRGTTSQGLAISFTVAIAEGGNPVVADIAVDVGLSCRTGSEYEDPTAEPLTGHLHAPHAALVPLKRRAEFMSSDEREVTVSGDIVGTNATGYIEVNADTYDAAGNPNETGPFFCERPSGLTFKAAK